MVLLPVVANIVLALVLLAKGSPASPAPGDARPGTLATGNDGVFGRALPEASVENLRFKVESLTGHAYVCEGPWTTGPNSVMWSCRTQDSVVIVEGRSASSAVRVDATWFGFDRTATDLPAWGAAAQSSAARATETQQWIARNVGQDAELSVGDVVLRVGGARGAETLTITSR